MMRRIDPESKHHGRGEVVVLSFVLIARCRRTLCSRVVTLTAVRCASRLSRARALCCSSQGIRSFCNRLGVFDSK